MNDFGDNVRKRRCEEGLSQEKLAQTVGISRNYLSQIERGEGDQPILAGDGSADGSTGAKSRA